MERLGTGTHEFTLHYTGTAVGETADNVITPVDPVWTVNYIPRSVPLLTVTGDGGADIPDKCTIVWKTAANAEVPQPVSVSPGTFLRYTITPNDSLKVGGVQYYKTYEGEVTLTERTQPVDVLLVAQGTVTVTPTASNKVDGTNTIPNSDGNSYDIKWYTKDGDNYTDNNQYQHFCSKHELHDQMQQLLSILHHKILCIFANLTQMEAALLLYQAFYHHFQLLHMTQYNMKLFLLLRCLF